VPDGRIRVVNSSDLARVTTAKLSTRPATMVTDRQRAGALLICRSPWAVAPTLRRAFDPCRSAGVRLHAG